MILRACSFVAAAAFVAAANASFAFDFNGIAPANNAGISSYMSSVYGSQITVTDAFGTNNATPPTPPPFVVWNGNQSDYLRSGPVAGAADFEISFDQVAIRSAQLLGYVFDESRGPVDFQIFAYDSTYGNRENPNASALVFHMSYNVLGNGTQIPVGPFNFGSDVSLLVFSDHGRFDVGIDDLVVESVPAPGALLLGTLGVSLIGWMKRRAA